MSGQQLNRTKTSLFFTRNTSSELRNQIQESFQVLEIKSHEKYLGLPSFIGRSKNTAFSELKRQVWRKMTGWKEKLLSHGGREILIKAIAQSIPTYTMSVFKLHDSLCQDLNSMFSNFWWGHHDKSRKAHWVSWNMLCKSKEVGGLGFRDLKSFNLALLAKQGWRLLHQPHSLIFQVLKAKYFPHYEFLEANAGYRPSYAWRSIASTRPVLKLGLRWHIGDVKSVRITKDPWLPLSSSFRSLSALNNLNSNERVSVLINEATHSWNIEAIHGLFSEWEASIICSIPLPPRPKLDRLLWNGTKSGIFTVKSAYFFTDERPSSCKGWRGFHGGERSRILEIPVVHAYSTEGEVFFVETKPEHPPNK